MNQLLQLVVLDIDVVLRSGCLPQITAENTYYIFPIVPPRPHCDSL